MRSYLDKQTHTHGFSLCNQTWFNQFEWLLLEGYSGTTTKWRKRVLCVGLTRYSSIVCRDTLKPKGYKIKYIKEERSNTNTTTTHPVQK